MAPPPLVLLIPPLVLLLPPYAAFPVAASERGSSTSGTICRSAEPPLSLTREAAFLLPAPAAAGGEEEQGEAVAGADGHSALMTREAAVADGQAATKGPERPECGEADRCANVWICVDRSGEACREAGNVGGCH